MRSIVSLQGPVRTLILVGLLCSSSIGSAIAGDIQLGQKKANAACAVCHGPLGIASMPSAPHLAGQVPDYLALQLKNYRSGKRAHEVMAVIARQLSDDDISDLAAWYGSIKISIDPRPQ
ncbi:MAG: c-type cytochrome [Luteolibacter sp.]|jgi:cytochrome c553